MFEERKTGIHFCATCFSGGLKSLRDALYMPALVAMRFNPDLKARYTALRDAGKPAKVAIVALIKADRHWVEKAP